MEPKNNNFVEMDIKELCCILLHKSWIIILVGVIGVVGTWAICSFLLQPMYTSTTKVYVINRQDETKMTYSDLQTGTQLAKDYMILVKSRPVTEQVINNLKLDLTSDELSELIEVNSPQDTRVLEIKANYMDPEIAKQIVDSVALISSERMVTVMEIEKVNIMEEGNLPTLPSYPSIARDVILGGLIGVIFSTLAIIFVHIMNDSIKTEEDIEKYLGITTLGMLPIEEGSSKKNIKNELKIKRGRKKQKAALAG